MQFKEISLQIHTRLLVSCPSSAAVNSEHMLLCILLLVLLPLDRTDQTTRPPDTMSYASAVKGEYTYSSACLVKIQC